MQAFAIECPVKGVWSFKNPPGHHPNAKDFVAVNEGGWPYSRIDLARHLFLSLNVANVFAWEKEVFAPFDGEMVSGCSAPSPPWCRA
jgi:hypothetical protein